MKPKLILITVAVVAAFAYAKLPGVREPGTFDVHPPTPYFHYLPIGASHGRVLLVHGLDANKEIMNLMGYALGEAGFDVYSIDLPGHGDSTAAFNAVRAGEAVGQVLDILGPHTTVIGHSLGATLLLDLANDRPFDQMVLLSPAPTPVHRIQAQRVLVRTGQFDLPRILAFVPQLDNVELRTVPWAGHSGYVAQPAPIREVVLWLGGTPAGLNTARRLGLLMLIILPAFGLGILLLQGSNIPAARVNIPTTIVTYVAAALAACIICAVTVVMQWLGLFSTDYLISFVLLTGMAQIPRCLRQVSFQRRQIRTSLLVSAGVIAIAAFPGSELVHLSVAAGNWWRFIVIAAAILPLALADEVLLRPLRPFWKSASLLALTRILMTGFIVTGVLTTNRSDGFLVLIIHLVVLFWIGLWFAGEWLRRHTQDPLATALFMALVQAWIFAAIFVRG